MSTDYARAPGHLQRAYGGERQHIEPFGTSSFFGGIWGGKKEYECIVSLLFEPVVIFSVGGIIKRGRGARAWLLEAVSLPS